MKTFLICGGAALVLLSGCDGCGSDDKPATAVDAGNLFDAPPLDGPDRFDASIDAPPSEGGSFDGGVESFRASFASVYCDRLFACPYPWDDILGSREEVGSPERCTAIVTLLLERHAVFAGLEPLFASGTVHLNSDAAASCLTRVQSSCALAIPQLRLDFEGTLAAFCPDLFEGTIANGAACHRSEECASGFCTGSEDETCPGTCAAPALLGTGCPSPRPSAVTPCVQPAGDGFAYCRNLGNDNDGGPSLVCTAVEVLPDVAEGLPCGVLSDSNNTQTVAPCAANLWCNDGVCDRPIASGSPCTSSGDVCVTGAFCVSGMCGGFVRHNVGNPCGGTLEEGYCSPLDRLTCVNGACALGTDGNSGSSCAVNCDDCEWAWCNSGLTCHIDTGMCGIPLTAGSQCSESFECASGSCDSDTSQCAAIACR